MFTDYTMEVEEIDSLLSHKMRCMSFGQWTGLYRPTMSEDFPAQEGFFYRPTLVRKISFSVGSAKKNFVCDNLIMTPAMNIGHLFDAFIHVGLI